MIGQFGRYIAVGLALNAALFLLYLALVAAGLTYYAAMSVSYAAGVVLGFALNRRITFGHRGRPAGPFGKYLLAYAAGYGFNLSALWLLADRLALPHGAVQAVIIVATACLMFLIQRIWIFSAPPAGAAHSTEPAA